MKTPWHVRRTSVAPPDAERRWDYAYQGFVANLYLSRFAV